MITKFESFASALDSTYYKGVDRRTKAISKGEFVELLDGVSLNGVDWRSENPVIWRGLGKIDADYIHMDPIASELPRVSRNTHNYYTLWMDNHPDWEGWPKRSRSFVCTTDRTKAERYGNQYVIIPLIDEHTPVAMCPTSDIWTSLRCRFEDKRTLKFFSWMQHLVYRTNIGPQFDTFDSFLRTAKDSWVHPDMDMTDLGEMFVELGVPQEWEGFLGWVRDKDKEHGIKLEEMIRKLVNPNDFELRTYAELANLEVSREVWFSAPAVGISYTKLLRNQGKEDNRLIRLVPLGEYCP